MNMQDITVSQTYAHIGDAALKLFRTFLSEPQRKTVGGKLFHEHVYYECHLLLRGRSNFVIGEHSVCVEERQLLIIPPKQDHRSFKSVSVQSDAKECVFGLTLEPTEGEFRCYPYFHAALQKAACTPIPLSDSLYNQLIDFLDGFEERGGILRNQCKQLSRVYTLLYLLFDAINGFELPQYSEQKNQNTNLAVTLDEMVNEPSYSLGDIARILGYSYRHTARRIREIYGDNLVNVRRAKMLSSAKALLVQNQKMTLESIARQSGFPSTHTMIRAFHSVESMTPTEYRNKMLSIEKGESET